MTNVTYTTQLQAGLGMIDETRELLSLWVPGDSASRLFQRALESGRFPSLSARRLRNIIAECFGPRFMSGGDDVTAFIRDVGDALSANEFRQLCLIYTCRANQIVADFIRDVYWNSYAMSCTSITKSQARDFVDDAIRDGRTAVSWSDATRRRIAGYLTGTLADFGFLESTGRGDRELKAVHLEQRVAGILTHDLHFKDTADSGIVLADEWSLFGLEPHDTTAVLKRLSLQNWFVYQSAGATVRLGWKFTTRKELANAISDGEL